MQATQPEEHSATGSASELHGEAQQAGWQGPKEGGVASQNGPRESAQQQPQPGISKSAQWADKGQSPAPSRQASRSFSLQSSLSEPVPSSGTGQEAPLAVPNPPGRARGPPGTGMEPQLQLQRDSASQVEIAARAVEAREAEKERLRYATTSLSACLHRNYLWHSHLHFENRCECCAEFIRCMVPSGLLAAAAQML